MQDKTMNDMMREAKHTPEPWSVYEGGEVHGVLDSTGRHLAEMWHRKGWDSLANARRIVACVNFCKGIPTETLAGPQAGPSMSELVAHYGDDDAQAAELTALREENARKDAALKKIAWECDVGEHTAIARAAVSASPAPAQEQGERVLREALESMIRAAKAEWFRNTSTISWVRIETALREGALLSRQSAEVEARVKEGP